MERVAFLVEQTGQRLVCMLNPESLVMRRSAGVRPRRAASGPLTGDNLADNPLLYIGGGTTELTLALLFDVSIAGSTIASDDVRDLTRPFWDMAENAGADRASSRSGAPLVTFIWGKAFSMTGVVAAVAEKLEHFTPQGSPSRSWMRLRLLRSATDFRPAAAALTPPVLPDAAALGDFETGRTAVPADGAVPPSDDEMTHVVVGGTNPDDPDATTEAGVSGERLDQIAHRYYGDATLWRVLAMYNGISDPTHLQAGTVLRIPSAARPGRLT